MYYYISKGAEGPLNINARNETMTQSADDIQNLHTYLAEENLN